uniref:Uncharacterized protein n=1 Tax=Rhizophora mucronata TaxID=61149 RepID=A0A2P2NR51_RHIMU
MAFTWEFGLAIGSSYTQLSWPIEL